MSTSCLKIVASIEARMSSSRLPGKVLKPVLGKPILHYLVERLKAVPQIDEIVLATTVNEQDNILQRFAEEENISCYRGSEHNVMERVIKAVESTEGDLIVEITGDCPIIDHGLIDQAINTYLYNSVSYVSNAHVRTYPDGMDVQVFSLVDLKRSYTMTNNSLDFEHVSLHMRKNPALFTPLNIVAPSSLFLPQLGLTLDEIDDFVLISSIIKSLYPQNPLFSCQDIVNFLDANPQLIEINNHVARKGDT